MRYMLAAFPPSGPPPEPRPRPTEEPYDMVRVTEAQNLTKYHFHDLFLGGGQMIGFVLSVGVGAQGMPEKRSVREK